MVTDAKQAHIMLDGERNVRNSFRVHAHLCNGIACVPLIIGRGVCLDKFLYHLLAVSQENSVVNIARHRGSTLGCNKYLYMNSPAAVVTRCPNRRFYEEKAIG